MRRIGWFVVGVAATAGAIAAVPALRDRLRGEPPDDLPLAVGLDDALLAEDDDDTAEVEPLVGVPHTDDQADELREKIDTGRARLREKTRAETRAGAAGPTPEQKAEAELEDDDEAEPPDAG